MRSFCDCCASELNNTAMPSPHACTKPAYRTVKSGQSCICSTKSLLFCAIVAVVEFEVDRQYVAKVDFRECREREAQNEASVAKIHIWRRDIDVGMLVAYHLGGPVGTACDGGGKCWRKMAQTEHGSQQRVRRSPLAAGQQIWRVDAAWHEVRLCQYHSTAVPTS